MAVKQIPEGCWCDGKFCPHHTDDCWICPLWTGWAELANSVFPQSVIVGYLKKISKLLVEHPDRPPGVCGLIWDLQNLCLNDAG
jgi:hypothetical protein